MSRFLELRTRLYRTPRQFQRSPDRLAGELWLRIERQTLRRLRVTGAVLFTIRIHVSPLTDLVDPLDREQLAVALSGLPETMLRYKSMTGFAQGIVAWLRTQSSPLA